MDVLDVRDPACVYPSQSTRRFYIADNGASERGQVRDAALSVRSRGHRHASTRATDGEIPLKSKSR
jgi:hypothetical protein